MDIRRYDIVQADLGETIGSEQGGIRPVLIIQFLYYYYAVKFEVEVT